VLLRARPGWDGASPEPALSHLHGATRER